MDWKNWKNRISKIETSIHGQSLSRDCFVYKIANEEDKSFDGKNARKGVELMMQRLRKNYEAEKTA